MPRLSWPDLRNARDLGGIATIGGGRVRDRVLVRTDNHHRLGAAGLAALRGYGVSRVLDLRWPSEAAAGPSPPAADASYRLVPACFDPTGDEDIPPDSYRLLVDASRDHLHARYGGVTDYLLGSGVTPAHLSAVRARLT
ncbi:tyrosine-protein phosphatase [Micromonospora sp. NPDC051141]|uniref:tyrosine-protein phosphatase n=1 Tax=Micromonospora sp. NPDC051141 TaxID=3364284 RepID=UPI00379E0FD3